jgi:uncharacterized protein (UPF0332 family)
MGELVGYWMSRAREAVDEAELMANAGHWNAAVNRLYYACFYAVTALLLRHGLSSAKHTGVRSLFNRHFGRSGLIPRDLTTLFNDLFDSRREGDYIEFVHFAEPQVRPWLADTRRFVDAVAGLLASSVDSPDA